MPYLFADRTSGEQEKISIREKYKDLECVGDESGKPIKTPSLLPHLGKSMHMNMGKQVPIAVAKPPRTPSGGHAYGHLVHMQPKKIKFHDNMSQPAHI